LVELSAEAFSLTFVLIARRANRSQTRCDHIQLHCCCRIAHADRDHGGAILAADHRLAATVQPCAGARDPPRPALPPAGRYHDVDFQMQLRNCPPWVDRPLRYTGDLARNFSGAAFLAMAAASCRLRKSVAAHLFWPCIECRGSARVRCTQFRQRTRQPTTFASMWLPVSSLAKHRPSINTGKELLSADVISRKRAQATDLCGTPS
jgi:hypothetical protein